MTYQLNFPALWPYLPELLSGLLITIELTAIATLGGIALGIVGAAIRCSHDPRLDKVILRRVWGGYVEIVRNTPFVVQLFFIVFGLPALGLKLSAGLAAVLAMTINLGAYSTEIIRAGIQASAKGQWEAGRVLGLSRSQTFFRVILPPSLQRIYPALVSQCIIVMLGSAVVSQVSFEELTFAANLIQSRTFLSFEVYLVTTLLYLLLSIAMRQLLLAAGRRFFGSRAS
ncbi:TPA: amino acid ABC transporter permease [Yersinia enterocolitica]|nr:amino acid ABC transporter permease [Yersinia enterocolitica]EKN6378653.1 amino acid ABC transporter permease [Yersinia enterocolitica]HDM8276212.1 amino acid ABC transporter permease [Yersinia enterocolitica]